MSVGSVYKLFAQKTVILFMKRTYKQNSRASVKFRQHRDRGFMERF